MTTPKTTRSQQSESKYGGHPRKDLDALVHSPVRFSLLAALQNLEDVDFRFIADLLEVSDSTLSQTLTVLADAGLVTVRKEAMGRRTRTWVGITATGRIAFERHLETLQAIVSTGTVEQPSEETT
ncbi:MarR/EmrR family transcriptional regulator [Corynebacterium suranareeae]|uniref:MarR/EmrR family transcriptional regulator n=1 Tax=Corynebacterium suranareeae TaxID=2506452 RepID=A0A160PPD8_9CORY|nr:transcriptional regulator [Corynebacterium suranareeae]BAU95225.1 MarR/EmrR family transcriptional regulator [Corynebacterium suranareeae]